jgi:lipopolysaccharide transport system ATP-binding protein
MVGLGFNDNNGVRIFNVNNEITGNPLSINKKEGSIVCEISNLPLVKGEYPVTIFVSVKGDISDWIQDAFVLNVEEGDFFGCGKTQFKEQGSFLVKNIWSIEKNDEL